MHEKKTIFTPGPVKMSPEIMAVGGEQTPYFRNKEFSSIVNYCEKSLLKMAFAPDGSRVIFLTASGTAAMEATVINLLKPTEKTIIINGGGFGQRFVDICHCHELNIYDVKVDKDNLSDTKKLLNYQDAAALCINGHETSIGLAYDLDAIGNFCKKNQLLNIVDGISLFVTDPLNMQEQNIDALIIGSQKGLALAPGLSLIILSPNAIKQIQSPRSFYFDFKTYLNDGLRGQTPFTPAVSIILQLQQRLQQIEKKGILIEQNKTKEVAEYFRNEIKSLPLKAYTEYIPNAMTALMPRWKKSIRTG